MKIALAQLNYCIGNFEQNTKKIIGAALKAKADGADLVVFSELSVCGYFPFDCLEFDDFIDNCQKALDEIAEKCFDIPVLVGAPLRNDIEGQKPLFNAAIFLYQNQRQVFKKKYIGDNPLFDERKYFEPSHDDEHLLDWAGHHIAVALGDDLANHGTDPILMENKVDELKKLNPEIVIALAASAFDYTMPHYRSNVLRQTVLKHELPLIMVNQVGAQTHLIFDGGSMAFASNGYIDTALPFFEEAVKIVNTDNLFINRASEDRLVIPEKMSLIHDALVIGVRDYFQKMGFKNAIIGLSGGLDSALVTYFAAKAIGSENVRVVLLPSQFSTDHSVSDAVALAEKLGVRYDTVAIKPIFDSFDTALKPFFEGRPFDVTEENLQARIRGVILMAFSNKFGNVLLNTSNKSEASVGYGTLYGDMCGGLSVIGDVYKSEAYELSRFINRNEEIIPWHTIEKAPSAELRPDQKDSDSLPDYSLLDQILYQYIECSKSAEEIIAQGFERAVVERTIKMVNRNEFKRHQVAPILRVSPRAFGSERLIPIVAKFS
ncbi:MAG: NAD+ synthase [Bacteroidales bacterium]|nr:NAD+ synthase [Bacteroidales bacterium]